MGLIMLGEYAQAKAENWVFYKISRPPIECRTMYKLLHNNIMDRVFWV